MKVPLKEHLGSWTFQPFFYSEIVQMNKNKIITSLIFSNYIKYDLLKEYILGYTVIKSVLNVCWWMNCFY